MSQSSDVEVVAVFEPRSQSTLHNTTKPATLIDRDLSAGVSVRRNASQYFLRSLPNGPTILDSLTKLRLSVIKLFNRLGMAYFDLIWRIDKSAAGGSPCDMAQGLPRAFTKSNKPPIS